MDEKISLYEHFGKFMGREVQPNDNAFKAIKAKADELNLTTRFMATTHSQEDFGLKHNRLNVVMDPKRNIVAQIALG